MDSTSTPCILRGLSALGPYSLAHACWSSHCKVARELVNRYRGQAPHSLWMESWFLWASPTLGRPWRRLPALWSASWHCTPDHQSLHCRVEKLFCKKSRAAPHEVSSIHSRYFMRFLWTCLSSVTWLMWHPCQLMWWPSEWSRSLWWDGAGKEEGLGYVS